MAIQFNLRSGGCQSQSSCPDRFGCPSDRCPDFVIRRHDTLPPLKVSMQDCDGPMDFQGYVIETNMWALARLKANIDNSITYFGLVDNIGFEQVMIGDIIVMDRVRMPERMLVTGFDEELNLLQVQRGYHGTTPTAWKKGDKMRIFRILNGQAESEMLLEDHRDIDGQIYRNRLTDSFLVYQWQPEDTCLPGCYWLEFKVIKMIDAVWYLPGGHWTGSINSYSDGYFYTGIAYTDSSVRLSYDQTKDKYLLPNSIWLGATHVTLAGDYYTGSNQDDGVVLLSKSNVPFDEQLQYNEFGLVKGHQHWYVLGGDWAGTTFETIDGKFYTGSSYTDGSVQVFYNGTSYYSNKAPWFGSVHLFTDGNWYTGTNHDSASMMVVKIFTPIRSGDIEQLGEQHDWDSANGWGIPNYEGGYSMSQGLCDSLISVTPSFTPSVYSPSNMSLTLMDYGCILGEGVESIRRFPMEGEGFLIKVTDSPTSEL